MKKHIAFLLAVTISLTVCGCSKEESSSTQSKAADGASVEQPDVSTASEDAIKISASEVDTSLDEYADSLERSKPYLFETLESAGTKALEGTLAPQKFDYDHDGYNELVTFTFKDNRKANQDLLVSYIEADKGVAEVKDKIYLSELSCFMNDNFYSCSDRKTPTAVTSMQLVASEYNNEKYFAFQFCNELAQSTNPNGFSAFCISDGKIKPIMMCKNRTLGSSQITNVWTSTLLPESIADSAQKEKATVTGRYEESFKPTIDNINNMLDKDDSYLLYLNRDYDDGEKANGLYSSNSEVYSAMLNDYGLDYVIDNDNMANGRCASFKALDNAKVEMILSSIGARFGDSGQMTESDIGFAWQTDFSQEIIDAQNTYIDYLEGDFADIADESKNDAQFAFMYIDDNNVPELAIDYIDSGSMLNKLISVNNGSVIENNYPYYPVYSYTEKSGRLLISNRRMTFAGDKVCDYEDGSFNDIWQGVITQQSTGYSFSVADGDKRDEVSKDEYLSELQKLIDVDMDDDCNITSDTAFDYSGNTISYGLLLNLFKSSRL